MEVGNSLDALFSRASRPGPHRVEAMASRLRAAPRFLEEAKARFQRPVGYWVAEARRSCDSTAAFLGEVVDAGPDVLGDDPGSPAGEALLDELAAAAGEARRALGEFGAWLDEEVAPRAEGGVALGPEAFAQLLHLRRLGYDTDGLRALGREAFADLTTAYQAELGRDFPGLSVDEAEAAWGETAPGSFEEALDLYRRAVEETRVFVDQRLGLRAPGPERLEVRETPGFLRAVLPSAAYFEPERFGPEEHHGIYLVTRPDDDADLVEHAPGMAYNTSSHEGYPGHHLQLSWAARTPSLFRAAVGGDEFCEGWAHYCEEMMFDEGFHPVPGMRAGQLKDALFRALRIQVDVGLQTGELSVDAAVDLLVEQGRIPRGRAVGEVSWYTTQPGYPLGYLTGKLLMWDLRREAQAREGEAFRLQGFHEAVLGGGTMPIWAHRRRLQLLAGAVSSPS